MFLILGLAVGLTSGLAIITAQRFGQKDHRGLRRSVAVSLVIILISSTLLTVVSTVFTRDILELLRTPPEIIDAAYAYLIVIFAGTVPLIGFNYLANILRAVGDSRTPLLFLIMTSVLNIVLDYVFILGFNMHVEGAAYATVIAQVFSALLCMIYIKKKVPILVISKKDFTRDLDEYKEHLRIGLPYGFQYSIIAIGLVAVQMTLNRLGADAVAAYTASTKIEQLLTLPLQTMGVALSTYVAQNFGALQFKRIKQGLKSGLFITTVYAFLIGVILILFGRKLSGFFIESSHTEVLALSESFFIAQSPFYILLALVLVLRPSIQGIGNSFVPTVAGILELVARIIGALVLSHYYGFLGAVLSNPLAWLLASVPLAVSLFYTLKIFEKEPTKKDLLLTFGSKKAYDKVEARRRFEKK